MQCCETLLGNKQNTPSRFASAIEVGKRVENATDQSLIFPNQNCRLFIGVEQTNLEKTARLMPMSSRPNSVIQSESVSLPSIFMDSPDIAPQLQSIKAHLDLALLALEALTGISSDAVLKTAQRLGLEEFFGDRLSLWRMRQSSPLRKGKGRKNLDIEEAQALTLVICSLARQYQGKIRQAIAKLEQLSPQKQSLHQEPILADYLEHFHQLYCERMMQWEAVSPSYLEKLSLKLLVDLLFYSAPNGDRRLWIALWDHSLGR